VTEEARNAQEGELVEVWREQGHPRAHVIKSKLEAAGVPATLAYDAAGLIYGLTMDGLGQVRVLVRAEDAELARELLNEEPTETEDEPESDAAQQTT